jgi:hypothetical protein
MNLDFIWDRIIIGSGAGAGSTKKEFLPKRKSFSKISIHVWSAIGIDFKSSLIIFEQKVNFAIYAEALIKSGFVELANATFGKCHWYLVQDGASWHTSTQSLNAIFEICNVFPEWPRIPLT